MQFCFIFFCFHRLKLWNLIRTCTALVRAKYSFVPEYWLTWKKNVISNSLTSLYSSRLMLVAALLEGGTTFILVFLYAEGQLLPRSSALERMMANVIVGEIVNVLSDDVAGDDIVS